MKRLALVIGVLAGLSLGAIAAESDGEVAARRVALELAGAFSNDGFKLRDGHWSGSFELKKPQIIQVNLYAGNEYWFSVGATEKARKISVAVFDEAGKPVESDPYQEGATAAAGFAPEFSGPHYIRVELLEGEPAAFCLLYSYK